MAEPPPSNSSSAGQSSQIKSHSSGRRRTQQGLGDGGNSDSDSDSDKRRICGDGGGAGPATKLRRAPASEVVPTSSNPRRLALTEEEERERIQEMRVLREVEDKMPDTLSDRELNSEDGSDKRRCLILFHEQSQAAKQKELLDSLRNQNVYGREREEAWEQFKAENHDAFWYTDMRSFVSRLDQQRRDYLDEALFRNIEDNLEAVTGDISGFSAECLRQTVERVEMGFLRRCSKFDVNWSSHHEPPSSLQAHLVDVIQRMSRTHWSYAQNAILQHMRRGRNPLRRDIQASPSGADSALAANVLVDRYTNKVLDALVTASDGAKSFQDQETSLEPLYNLIINSRSRGHLSKEYLEWITSNIDPVDIERCCLRATALAKYREITKSLNIGIKQVFCPDIFEPGVVSLVTFKGTLATSIKPVSNEDLYIMGWFWDERLGQYWRFEVDKRPPNRIFTEGTVFKVSMDEETLGMYVGTGDMLEWNPNMKGVLRNQNWYRHGSLQDYGL